jgi:hypothetical protein
MIHSSKMLFCVTGTVALCMATAVLAIESEGTPYKDIAGRNVFGLKPIPPAPGPEANLPPPPKITLTGIFTILGNKRAMMKVAPPARPGVKPEEQSYVLAVGQRDGDIEVLDIDEKAGIVKVNNYGTITNINWENNGAKIVSAPAPPVPGAPGAMGGGLPPPPGGVVAPAANPYNPRTIPTARQMRTNPTGAANYGGGYGNTAASASYGGAAYPTIGGTMPATATPGSVTLNNLGAPASTPTKQQNWPPEATSPEAQAILDHVYTTTHANEIQAGMMPPIPGANPIQELQGNSGQTTTTTPVTTTPTVPLPAGAARRYVPPGGF